MQTLTKKIYTWKNSSFVKKFYQGWTNLSHLILIWMEYFILNWQIHLFKNWVKCLAEVNNSIDRNILVWPQWWSFADVSQQGLHLSKKISKIRIIFWFDFHRCSQGPSKIRRHFRNKSHSILKLSINVFYKICGPRLIFLNEIFF